jgi:transcriptional regulator with XRE-family HTH domain
MNIGNKISDLRKKLGFSRDDLGKLVGTSGAVIGRYEREEITPSIEVASKIAKALEVSLDYLTGETNTIVNDKKNALPLRAFAKNQQKGKRDYSSRYGFSFTNSTNYNYSTKTYVIMNLQYISDSKGKTTGVFIPIKE